MENILVTGSNGFIGKALIKKLESLGHRVIGFDISEGNITTKGSLDNFREKNISHVFHLAGKTFVPESWSHPLSFYEVNVMGTLTSLEFCRETGAGITYISSYLYGKPDYLPVDELHPLKVYNPYNHSKNVAEDICRYYRDNFHLDLIILRPFNAFGPGQPDHFIIPEIIRQVLDPQLEKVEVMDLRPKRDYLYIDDLVNAMVRSMDAPRGIYNVGSGYSLSVEEIIKLVIEITGIRKPYFSKNTERPNEIFDLYADITKISNAFGWKPETSFRDGVSGCIRDFMQKDNQETDG
jgi:nucleoside-diphosphate-sugar epimerase